MPKRSSKVPEDSNQIAARIVGGLDQPADDEKNPHAVALGRLGGLKGGKARADKLSEKKRKSIARNAARARWSKQKSAS